jgi:hypothetical protein
MTIQNPGAVNAKKGWIGRRRPYVKAMAEDDELQFTNEPLHAVFEQQVREMLDRSELSEEQKQEILVALQCPCCGAGGLSLSVKLKD